MNRLFKFLSLFYRNPDVTLERANKMYLRRWHVIPRNKYFNVYLHHFVGPDNEKELHDHPWFSLSFLIRGRYIEHSLKYPDGKKYSAPNFFLRPASFFHRVEYDGGAWTIFITGPMVKPWGFMTSWVQYSGVPKADRKSIEAVKNIHTINELPEVFNNLEKLEYSDNKNQPKPVVVLVDVANDQYAVIHPENPEYEAAIGCTEFGDGFIEEEVETHTAKSQNKSLEEISNDNRKHNKED